MGQREQQILDAAERLFYERGFDGVGVDAIAEQAGISGGGIYRHFSGKSEILAALFDSAIDSVLEHLPSPSDDPDQDLRNLIEAHVRFAQAHPRLAGIWTREARSLPEIYMRSYERRQRRYVERWRGALSRRFPHRDALEIDVALRALDSLTLSDATRPVGSRSAPGAADLLVEMAVLSLRALAADDAAADTADVGRSTPARE
jgi:AcrR family transcriptional regulator